MSHPPTPKEEPANVSIHDLVGIWADPNETRDSTQIVRDIRDAPHQLPKLRNRIDAATALHQPQTIKVHSVWETVCSSCDPQAFNWPCPTYQALHPEGEGTK